jgi:hypothetical protein
MKICPHCKENKSAEYYYANRRAKDGLSSYCKQCQNVIRRYKRANKLGFYAQKDRDATRKRMREKIVVRKQLILNHYGQQCTRCGFNDIRALSVDHINGDGAKHRKEIPSCNLYEWLIDNDYPKGFQILCMNCQWIKRHENQECRKFKMFAM